MSSSVDSEDKALTNALNNIDDEGFVDAKAVSHEDMKLIHTENNLNKVLKFLEDYANKGVLCDGVCSIDIDNAIEKVKKTYGFIDSYPPLSEKLSIIDNDREGYRLLLSGYNPFEMEKEKFDALVNGSYSDRLMSDKYASIYYAYHDGLKAFKEDQRQMDFQQILDDNELYLVS